MRRDPDRVLTFERARIRHLARLAGSPGASMRPRLDVAGDDAVTVGYLDGKPYSVPAEIWQTHLMIVGPSGLGKSREGAALLMQPIERMAAGGPKVRVAVGDIKDDTSELIATGIAHRLRDATDAEGEWYETKVRPLAFRADRVTPMPLFRANGALPPSLQAHLRAATVSRTADVPFTDGMRAAFRPLGHLLALMNLPLSLPWTIRFFDDDPGFRTGVLSRVPDRDVKSFFEALPTTVPKNTRLGLIRRIADLTSHRLLKYVIGTPPGDVERLLPSPEEAMVELGFLAPKIAMPYGPARERAASWLLDELLLGQIRTEETPKIIAVEELAVLASIAPEIVPALADGSRVLRSKKVALYGFVQDASSLPKELQTPLLLNARWMLCFRGDEARILLPHLEGVDGRGRAEIERDLATLPERTFYAWIKERPPARLTSVPFPDPWGEAGTTKEELLEEFFRATSRWMLPVATCEELIARFEEEVVASGAGTAGEAPQAPKPVRRTGGLAALLSALDGEPDAGEGHSSRAGDDEDEGA